MTIKNHTPNEEMMLQACKHYIRITQVNEFDLVKELMDLATQYCSQLPEEMKDKKEYMEDQMTPYEDKLNG